MRLFFIGTVLALCMAGGALGQLIPNVYFNRPHVTYGFPVYYPNYYPYYRTPWRGYRAHYYDGFYRGMQLDNEIYILQNRLNWLEY